MLANKLRQLDELDQDDIASPSPTAIATSYFDMQDLESIHRRRHPLHARNSTEVSKEESDVSAVAAAIEEGSALNVEQINAFERIIKWEIDALDDELKGKCSDTANIYPRNLNLRDFAGYIPLPTVVYELEYPRQEHIDWYYVAEKGIATFGIIGVMIVVSQAFIYPSVLTTFKMKEDGMPLVDRLKEFPWLLSDLLFPFMMEYLLAWYVIWECIVSLRHSTPQSPMSRNFSKFALTPFKLNLLAELTRFADRGFYGPWWNSVAWDEFARDWNRPVHNFLFRHVYHSSISAFKVSRPMATLITFFLSACVHELVMWCIFKKLRGYLMVMQMMQLPLVVLSRSRWMKGKSVLGNMMFWFVSSSSFRALLHAI